jgi:LCP family protein required for cell wall assembly
VAGLLQFKQLASEIGLQPPLSGTGITLPAPGAPQTILIIGSDHRVGEPFTQANTDTMMLVRLNADSSTINVLSIPRDLKVDIPGFGPNRINSAYQAGGDSLMIKTIRQDVFPRLKINHIVDVNFAAFSDLVDAIGCVYGQVDQRYYNVSGPGANNFSSINIEPGYQRLCGHNQSVHGALPFVRYRHTDSDIVRNARQQDFIRWAKEQYSTSQLFANRDTLLSIFGRNAQTDRGLHSIDGLINLFNLVINADGSTIKSIPFPVVLSNCPAAAAGQPQPACYVGSQSSAALLHAYDAFMRPTRPAFGRGSPTSAARKVAVAPAAAASMPRGLIADPGDGVNQAKALGQMALPVYYPKLILAGSAYCSSATGNCDDGLEPAAAYNGAYPRRYIIRDRRGVPHAAYNLTLAINPSLGRFYDVQGTTWTNPPLLANPQATKTIKGKTLYLYAAGGRLTTVALKTPHAVYWISNTLDSLLSDQQIVAIAASLTR